GSSHLAPYVMRFSERFISPEKLKGCGNSCARSVTNKTISGCCCGGSGTGTLATLGQVSSRSAQPEQRQTTAREANSAAVGKRCNRSPGFIRPRLRHAIAIVIVSAESYPIVVAASDLTHETFKTCADFKNRDGQTILELCRCEALIGTMSAIGIYHQLTA